MTDAILRARGDETDLVLLLPEMIAITGGARSVDPTRECVESRPTTDARIAAALLECAARWGLAKTTIDDVAKAAGVSRATVYRLYPGGKSAISDAASHAEVVRLSGELDDALRGIDDLEDALTETIRLAVSFLSAQEALSFLRDHEPAEFARLLGPERLDSLLCTAGAILSPLLAAAFVNAGTTDVELRDDVSVWIARIIASHVLQPSATVDLSDPSDARELVRSYVLPAISVQFNPVQPTSVPTTAVPATAVPDI